jgi:hypothetical protein
MIILCVGVLAGGNMQPGKEGCSSPPAAFHDTALRENAALLRVRPSETQLCFRSFSVLVWACVHVCVYVHAHLFTQNRSTHPQFCSLVFS